MGRKGTTWRKGAGLLALSLLSMVTSGATPTRTWAYPGAIVIDGKFADWDALLGSAHTAADLAVADSGRFLYFHFRLPQEAILQGTSDAVLLLDADADAATGRRAFGIGADVEWRFGARSGTRHAGAQRIGLHPADIGLVTAPTVSARRFELALELGARPGDTVLFTGRRIRAVLTTVQALLHGSGDSRRVAYRLGARSVPEPERAMLERAAARHLRVMNYNVEHDGLFDLDRQPAYQRIFSAVRPDVVGFQEVAKNNTAGIATLLDEWLPRRGGRRWHASAAAGDAAVASRFPISKTWLITPGVDAYRIDTRSFLASEMLVVVVSLKCCEDPAGQRRRQIDAILGFWRDALSPGSTVTLPPDTPIVMIGDMNLVGDAQELHALRTGTPFDSVSGGPPFDPDWDGSALTDLRPLHADLPMAYTWRRDNSSGNFSPGRLDFVFFTDSVLTPRNRFVLHTPSMTGRRRRAYGLRRGDTVRASDHLPLIADFALR
ncbi:MAG TPA: endonuclease/exonuclease/phosphatase family protein [Acidobacteriota bacterium]|nr:endonuclease/exonuclease/phosphatase family protein [Acidobacteriota bacterium]